MLIPPPPPRPPVWQHSQTHTNARELRLPKIDPAEGRLRQLPKLRSTRGRVVAARTAPEYKTDRGGEGATVVVVFCVHFHLISIINLYKAHSFRGLIPCVSGWLLSNYNGLYSMCMKYLSLVSSWLIQDVHGVPL